MESRPSEEVVASPEELSAALASLEEYMWEMYDFPGLEEYLD